MEVRLCDRNCNKCPLIIHKNSRLLSYIFNKLKRELGEKVYAIIQNTCPNLTVCYDCRIDDFTHFDECNIIKQIEVEKIGDLL